MKNNMLPRICRECGVTFSGGPRAWYCPTCRAERSRQHNKQHKMRKRNGVVVPIGSVISCEICGKETVKNSGQQRFCKECAPQHLKEIDNAQSLRWKAENPEKDKESKRVLSKIRHAEEGKQSGVKHIIWDKGSRKWKVCPYRDGKQHTIGRYSDLEEAKAALEKFNNRK